MAGLPAGLGFQTLPITCCQKIGQIVQLLWSHLGLQVGIILAGPLVNHFLQVLDQRLWQSGIVQGLVQVHHLFGLWLGAQTQKLLLQQGGQLGPQLWPSYHQHLCMAEFFYPSLHTHGTVKQQWSHRALGAESQCCQHGSCILGSKSSWPKIVHWRIDHGNRKADVKKPLCGCTSSNKGKE